MNSNENLYNVDCYIRAIDSPQISTECLHKKDFTYFIADNPREKETFIVNFISPDRITNIFIGKTNAKFVDMTFLYTQKIANSMNPSFRRKLQSEQTSFNIVPDDKIESIELEFTINPIDNLTLQCIIFRKPLQNGFDASQLQTYRGGGGISQSYQNYRSSSPLSDEIYLSRKNNLFNKKEELTLRDAPSNSKISNQARRVTQEGFSRYERSSSPNQNTTGYYKYGGNKKQSLIEKSFKELGLNSHNKNDSSLNKAIENSLKTEEMEKKNRQILNETAEKQKNQNKEDSNGDFDAVLLKVLEQSKREEELKQQQLKKEAEEVLRQAKKNNQDTQQKFGDDEIDDDIEEIQLDNKLQILLQQQQEKKEILKKQAEYERQTQNQQKQSTSLKEMQIPKNEQLLKSPEIQGNKNNINNNKTPQRSPQPKPDRSATNYNNTNNKLSEDKKKQQYLEDSTIRKNSYDNRMEIENQDLPDIEFIASPMKSRQKTSEQNNNNRQQRNQFPITTGMLSKKLLEWQRQEELKRNIKPEQFLYKPPGISQLLKGLNICISGAQGEEHARIKQQIYFLGAKYQQNLSEICDYMIASSTKTDKYNQYLASKDRLPKLKIVTKDFLSFCQNNKQLPPNWQTFKLTLG